MSAFINLGFCFFFVILLQTWFGSIKKSKRRVGRI